MVINDGQRYVRDDGLVEIDYLKYWRPKYCLLDLITVLSDKFSEETPLYAKTDNEANNSSIASSKLMGTYFFHFISPNRSMVDYPDAQNKSPKITVNIYFFSNRFFIICFVPRSD